MNVRGGTTDFRLGTVALQRAVRLVVMVMSAATAAAAAGLTTATALTLHGMSTVHLSIREVRMRRGEPKSFRLALRLELMPFARSFGAWERRPANIAVSVSLTSC
jgi:hypothetical protein